MTRVCLQLFAIACVVQNWQPAFANEKVYLRTARSAVMVVAGGSRASGVVIDKEKRLVLTAYHVTSGQANVEVVFPLFDSSGAVLTEARHYNDGRTKSRGRVVRADQSRDVSIIQVDQMPDSVLAIPLAKTSPRPGQDIHCIGNAAFRHGGLFGYSHGKVRNVFHRQVGGQLNGKVVVETQIPTNKGDSGGPIVNDDGELVAIVSQGTTGVAPPQNDPFHALQVVDHSVDVSEIRAVLGNVGKPSIYVLQTTGTLTANDVKRGNTYMKVHVIKFEVGSTYIINLRSTAFDTFLRLEDAQGKQIAVNDDGGGGLNSRLEYSPDRVGDYRLVVTSYTPLATGDYALDVERQ